VSVDTRQIGRRVVAVSGRYLAPSRDARERARCLERLGNVEASTDDDGRPVRRVVLLMERACLSGSHVQDVLTTSENRPSIRMCTECVRERPSQQHRRTVLFGGLQFIQHNASLPLEVVLVDFDATHARRLE